MLEADPSIEVVGTAMDGNFCLKKIEELRPTVVTLDLQMPGMNGIDTLKEIMRRHPVPVIVVSSHSTEGASITLKALGLGAFDFVAKPQDAPSHMAETARELIGKIKTAADRKIVRPGRLSGSSGSGKNPDLRKPCPRPAKLWLSESPPEDRRPSNSCWLNCRRIFPGRILVVQHMPEGFTEMFARRLDELCSLRVKEAQSGDVLQSRARADLPRQAGT